MHCQNYQIQRPQRQALLLIAVIFLSFALSLKIIYADDDCAKISDLDEKNACYEKELEEKQEDYESTSKKLDGIRSQKDSISKKITTLSSQLGVTDAEISDLEKDIKNLETELAIINKNLVDSNQALDARITLRNQVLRNYSKRNILNDLEIFLVNNSNLNGFEFSALSYMFDKSVSDESIKLIASINTEIDNFEKDKAEANKLKTEIESEQKNLIALKNQLVAQKNSAQQNLDSLQKQQSAFERELQSINSAISDLNQKQQQILKEKYGSETETVGDYESDYSELPDPDFSPAYAFYTYGYPHRVGMSQYGAYGRAKAGQNYKDILKAYYNDIKIEEFWDDDKKIPVQGYGEIKMKDYLYGLGEMPESWGNNGGMEALKAQVVAARSYALNYIYYSWDSKSNSFKEKSPTTICTTQACQVYTGGKKTGKWKQAVDETEGMVITYGGKPITAWYASTSGGYTRTSGQVWGGNRPWTKGIKDTACGGDLTNCAYEGPKYGDSPWFHKAWNSGYPAKNAWLKEDEAQDLVNAYLMWKKDNSTSKYLSPPSKDDDAWSKDELKENLEDKGVEPVGSISEIKAYDDGSGYTTKIVVKSENYDNLEMDGYDFKNIYNIRSREKLYIYTGFYSVRREN